MAIWDAIRSWFQPAGGDRAGQWIYVECERCGEVIKSRVDLAHDLTPEYGPSDRPEGYFTRKVLIGSGPCFQQIEVELEYDRNKQLTSRDIQGGSFVSRQDYENGETQGEGVNHQPPPSSG